MKRTHFGLLGASAGFAALVCGPLAALAQTAPPLGVVQQFSVLGNSGVTGSAGAGTVVSGDVGSSPTATISNFPPSSVTPPFTLHTTNDGTVQQARTDAIAASTDLAGQGPGTVLAAQLDTVMLTSGIYSFMGGAADLAMNGTLTLNGPGVFVFLVDSALTANVNSTVVGTANPCNVFWRIGTSATLSGVNFWGTVLADASITVGSGASVTGRAIGGTGPTGAVTMSGAGGNTIGGCASVPTGDACLSGADCDSGVCTDGVCAAGPPGGPCLSGADCLSGVCTDGVCAPGPPGAPCSSGADCGSGVCTDGVCVPAPPGGPCLSGADCVSGVCIDGVCAPGPPGAPCVSGADCVSGICSPEGVCVAAPSPAPALSPWAFALLFLVLSGLAFRSLRRAQ